MQGQKVEIKILTFPSCHHFSFWAQNQNQQKPEALETAFKVSSVVGPQVITRHELYWIIYSFIPVVYIIVSLP